MALDITEELKSRVGYKSEGNAAAEDIFSHLDDPEPTLSELVAAELELESESESESESELDDVSDTSVESESGQFKLTKADLVSQFSLDAIEAQERVVDPLKAVPDIPFGHLNGSWQRFLENTVANDAIWKFAAPRQSIDGYQEIRKGYAILRNGEIGLFFLTEWLTGI